MAQVIAAELDPIAPSHNGSAETPHDTAGPSVNDSARFDTLGLSADMLSTLQEVGYETPTPVQSGAIPLLLNGKDVLAQAQTGTGKTAAFAIPAIERIQRGVRGVQVLVLTPTRELAGQVAKEAQRLGAHSRVRALAIYGGQSYDVQLRALRQGVDVLVATPGRLMDHMRNGKIDLSQVTTLVLDEADEMLNMGFLEDVEFIMAGLPEGHQTALFSATMSGPIVALSERYMRSPVTLRLSQPQELTAPSVIHTYYVVPFKRKFDALTHLLALKQPERCLIFAATKRMVDELVEALHDSGFVAELIHSDISQPQRERAMAAFRHGRLPVLVATDVAARGIDVENVTHVINFDVPNDMEYYIHRVGRTGRVGRAGEALTLVNPWEERQIKLIERTTGARITKGTLPTATDAADGAMQQLARRVAHQLEKGGLEPYTAVLQHLMSDSDCNPLELAAAALSLLDASRAAPRPLGDRDLAAEVAAGMGAARRFDHGSPSGQKRQWQRTPPFRPRRRLP